MNSSDGMKSITKFEKGGGGYLSPAHIPSLIRNCLITLTLFVIVLCCLAFFFFGGFNNFYGLFTSPNQNLAKINLSKLLITTQDLPPGWLQDGSSFILGDLFDDTAVDKDSIGISFTTDLNRNPDQGLTQENFTQEIYRSASGFNSIGGAQDDYDRLVEYSGNYGNLPSDWKFKSQFADKSSFSCYTDANVSYPVCHWIARYNCVVIWVQAYLVPQHMTESELRIILTKIDARMGQVISRK